MMKPVDAEVLRAISFDGPSRGDSLTCGRPQGPQAARVLFDLLYGLRWGDVQLAALAVVTGTGIGLDEAGFRYPADLDPCEESFDGVNVYDPLDDIVVPHAAFEEVMARFFRALISGAQKLRDPVRSAPWWGELVRRTEELEARVAKAAPGGG